MSLILHISDSHLYADAAGELKGIRPHDSYAAVLSAALDRFADPEAVILGGDMAQDESAAAYKKVAEMLPWKAPVMISPGNHANMPVLRDALIPALEQRSSYADSLELENWQMITLVSHQKGSIGGYLADSELLRLRKQLERCDKHALVALHHQPLDVGSRWLDEIGLANSEALWDVVACFDHVKLLLCGHVHQAFDTMHDGVRVLGSPSTCIQFKPRNDSFGMDNRSPGYRWLRLCDDGHVETAVERIDGFIPPDLDNVDPY